MMQSLTRSGTMNTYWGRSIP